MQEDVALEGVLRFAKNFEPRPVVLLAVLAIAGRGLIQLRVVQRHHLTIATTGSHYGKLMAIPEANGVAPKHRDPEVPVEVPLHGEEHTANEPCPDQRPCGDSADNEDPD